MSKRILTEEQINQLLKNKNITKCTTKSIIYSKDFRTDAIRLYKQGLSATEIFKQADLDPGVIGKNHPRDCIRRWNKALKKKPKIR